MSQKLGQFAIEASKEVDSFVNEWAHLAKKNEVGEWVLSEDAVNTFYDDRRRYAKCLLRAMDTFIETINSDKMDAAITAVMLAGARTKEDWETRMEQTDDATTKETYRDLIKQLTDIMEDINKLTNAFRAARETTRERRTKVEELAYLFEQYYTLRIFDKARAQLRLIVATVDRFNESIDNLIQEGETVITKRRA